jgi:hypothetical protein
VSTMTAWTIPIGKMVSGSKIYVPGSKAKK